MNSNELKNIIENARIAKGISQRELAKLSGISRSTLNDIINGKIKAVISSYGKLTKIKIDDLYQISIPLELNLENLLEVCGFNSILKSLNTDRYSGMSDRQLKEKLDEYQQSELSLLNWDTQKRKKTNELGKKLFGILNKIEMSEQLNKNYTKKEIAEDIKEVIEELKSLQQKYDYSQLPRNK